MGTIRVEFLPAEGVTHIVVEDQDNMVWGRNVEVADPHKKGVKRAWEGDLGFLELVCPIINAVQVGVDVEGHTRQRSSTTYCVG